MAGAVALAEDSHGQVVGIVHARFNLETYNNRFGELEGLPRPQCMLDKIAVLPTARRSGVGKLLMRETATEAQRYGCSHLALMVDWSTELRDRVEFFKACGLRSLVSGRDDDLFGADLETVLRSTA
ncbi:GNAT family N-acetyltransferase [Lentzea sp. NEAU-D13]|uniref:GNAT family N-acetyltransferase n=1 Tax=Lentzea alba TaxID=2714351 RepID=A0A7C9W2I0_9PSEU|nr:GNAT family N-acetyltransferase [Lentzea alba]NGY63417.1 GNAT family N-acetyltransferase [Lentzea alba]